ncbi:MAG: tyrosine-type recombinase/integrase [Ginsengibacter sp.]
MTVSKTSSGRWRVWVKSGRRVVASRTFDRKSDAQAWHEAQKRSLSLGDFVDPRAGRITVREALREWLEEREGTVAGSTLSRDREIAKSLPVGLLSRPLNAIRPADLDSIWADLLRKGLARGTVARIRTTLSALGTWATKNGLLAKNPVRESVVPRGTQESDSHEIYPFTIEELREVHADVHAEVEDKRAADMILVLGLAGLRWGEISALRVRDVQIVPFPALRVSRSRPDGQQVRSVTKGGKPRTVPLLDEAWAVVQPLLNRRPDEILFPTTTGGMRLLSNWRRATSWTRYGRGRRVHDLRHTAATIWLKNGADIKTVQAWLGHASAKLTLDTYAHYMGTNADLASIALLNTALGYAGGTRARKLGTAK